MIITRSWLEEFIDISKISTDEICKTLNSIGLEVDSIEKISIPSKVVVGKVLERIKHPEADKLSICQVDLGEKAYAKRSILRLQHDLSCSFGC